MFLLMAVDLSFVRENIKLILLLSFFVLVLTLLPGISRQVGGAKRWLRIGMIGFQPSELVKIIFIVYIADYLSRKQKIINNFYNGFCPIMVALFIPVLLILLQPDLGTAFSLFCVTFLMLFMTGLDFKYFLGIVGISIPALYVIIFSSAYRRARILSFLDPWSDPKGIGFQIIQSQIALGSGGLFGLGIGQGRQKLFYLPAAHTDFIFSVITEEIGIMGAMIVISIFGFLLWQMVTVAKLCNDDFCKNLTIGLTILFALETTINIGVSLGLLPTKGLPLPFVSYGGSALVFEMAAMGLFLNASKSDETLY